MPDEYWTTPMYCTPLIVYDNNHYHLSLFVFLVSLSFPPPSLLPSPLSPSLPPLSFPPPSLLSSLLLPSPLPSPIYPYYSLSPGLIFQEIEASSNTTVAQQSKEMYHQVQKYIILGDLESEWGNETGVGVA